jgi:hypothetical protein
MKIQRNTNAGHKISQTNPSYLSTHHPNALIIDTTDPRSIRRNYDEAELTDIEENETNKKLPANDDWTPVQSKQTETQTIQHRSTSNFTPCYSTKAPPTTPTNEYFCPAEYPTKATSTKQHSRAWHQFCPCQRRHSSSYHSPLETCRLHNLQVMKQIGNSRQQILYIIFLKPCLMPFYIHGQVNRPLRPSHLSN